MFVQDFYVILYVHWVEDARFLPGLVRTQISTLYLLSAATATRPGALVESSSAKGTNKALWYEHVEILKTRPPNDPTRTVMAVRVNLVHVKDSRGKGRRYVSWPLESRSWHSRFLVKEEIRLLRGTIMGVLYRLPDRGIGIGGRRVPAALQVRARTAELNSACKSTGALLKIQSGEAENAIFQGRGAYRHRLPRLSQQGIPLPQVSRPPRPSWPSGWEGRARGAV